MNKQTRKANSPRSRKNAQRKRSRKSVQQQWLSNLHRRYGAETRDTALGRETFVQYRDQTPPRMPRPHGPSKGASLTDVFMVNTFADVTGSSLPIVASTAGVVSGGFAFTAADVADTTLITQFDQYRLDEVHLRIQIQDPIPGAPNVSPGNLQVVVARDDNTDPGTNLLTLKEFDNCQFIPGYQSLDIVLEPNFTPALFSGGSFSGFSLSDPQEGIWIDSSNLNVPHYGVKYQVSQAGTTTGAATWIVNAWYKISLRNVA